jgi:cellobiose phosphorylase
VLVEETIGDSMCGASHAKMMQVHKDMKTDCDCTMGCAKAGAKYVFVSDNGKVYQIANQDAASVMKNAGETVSVAGNVEGDTITVSKMTMMKH